MREEDDTLPHAGAFGTRTGQGADSTRTGTVLELEGAGAVALLQAVPADIWLELAGGLGCCTLTSVKKKVIRLICYIWNVKK